MSGVEVRLSLAQLGNRREECSGLDDVLREVVAAGGALEMRPEDGSLVLAAVDSPPPARGITLSGRWRSELLRGAGEPASLLLPFVFSVAGVRIEHRSLFTMGQSYRTVADLVMRNVFHAACRGELVARETDARQGELAMAAAKELARSYVWILKGALKDDIFSNRNAAELILASAHAPLVQFTSPLLRSAIEALRSTTRSHRESSPQAQLECFRVLRPQVLALVGSAR